MIDRSTWAALLATASLTACGGGGSEGGSTSGPPPAADALLSITVPGYPHAVNVYRTAGATRETVLLHGGGGDLNAVAYQVGLNDSATQTTDATIRWAWLDANKVTLVVPQGQHIASNPGATTWSNYAMTSGQDDKGFLQALAARIRGDYGLADITLMGHSMGGAGALYLAIKYPQRWAAIAALAPAAFAVDREGLSKIPKMPIMLVHGDMDTVVPVTVGRAWADAMKSVPMKTYEYIEVPGGDHGMVITSHQKELFAFFAKHAR